MENSKKIASGKIKNKKPNPESLDQNQLHLSLSRRAIEDAMQINESD
jgi:hypothetical protein